MVTTHGETVVPKLDGDAGLADQLGECNVSVTSLTSSPGMVRVARIPTSGCHGQTNRS